LKPALENSPDHSPSFLARKEANIVLIFANNEVDVYF